MHKSTLVVALAIAFFPRPLGAEPQAKPFTCELTRANGRSIPDSPVPGRHFYGNDTVAIGVGLDGLTITFEPGGAGFVLPDGSLQWKFLWAKVRLPMTIEGRRLDAPAPPLRSRVNHEFDGHKFQPSSLIFPTPGCWEITSRVGQSALTFVIKVVKIGEGPSRLASLQRLKRQLEEIEAQNSQNLIDRLHLGITPEAVSAPR
jgi:hypothetical protein